MLEVENFLYRELQNVLEDKVGDQRGNLLPSSCWVCEYFPDFRQDYTSNSKKTNIKIKIFVKKKMKKIW